MLTADTITDAQLHELFRVRPDARILFRDKVHLHETVEPYASLRRDARARCAEILNARQSACTHELVEVLSVNGRNLDGAVRRCARCGSEVK